MLHANEAWRQLTGAELQKGVSTGLWESFEFISAQALVRLYCFSALQPLCMHIPICPPHYTPIVQAMLANVTFAALWCCVAGVMSRADSLPAVHGSPCGKCQSTACPPSVQQMAQSPAG